MNIPEISELCDICIHEDFGYCGLRHSGLEKKVKHNDKGKIAKCSSFLCDDCAVQKICRITLESEG